MLPWGGDSLTVGLHAWQLCLALLIALGPLPACLVWVRAAEWSVESRSLARNWLALGVVWCALETAVGLGLGSLGVLRLGWVLLVQGGLFAAGLAWWYRARAPKSPRARELLLPSVAPRLGQCLILGAAGAVAAALVLVLTTRPFQDYDSLAYHLPTMARWFQTGHLERLEQFRWTNSAYPYSWEVLCALFLQPVHEDFLAAWPNLAAWALFGLAVYDLSRRLGARQTAAMAAGLAVVSMPGLMESVGTLHADLPMAAFFLGGLCFALHYLSTRSRALLGLFLLSLGLVAGVKTSGLVYDAVLVAVLLAGLLLRRHPPLSRPARSRHSLVLLLLAAACAVLLGGYWYRQNLVEYHNPVAPLRLQFGDRVLLPGPLTAEVLHRTSFAALFNPADAIDWGTLGGALAEHFGPAFPVLLCAALLGLAAVLLRGRPITRIHAVGLLSLLLLTGYLYIATPYSGDNGVHHWQITPWMGQALRYAYPCCGLLAAAAAVGATALGLPSWLLLLLGVTAVLPGLAAWRLLPMLLCAGTCWVVLPLLQRPLPSPDAPRLLDYRRVVLLLVAGLPVLLLGTYVARLWRTSERLGQWGGLPAQVQSDVGPQETIGAFRCSRTYLLYGPDLSRRVLRIPEDLGLNGEQWRQHLRSHRISVVAMGPVPARGADLAYALWLESDDGPLVRISGHPISAVALYRLKGDARIPPLANRGSEALRPILPPGSDPERGPVGGQPVGARSRGRPFRNAD